MTIQDNDLARAFAARRNAKRFADALSGEQDEAVRAYLRHLAVSWTHVAEHHEFLGHIHKSAAEPAE